MKVYEGNINLFQAKFDKVAKKAQKLGLGELIFNIVGAEFVPVVDEETDRINYVKMLEINIEGLYPLIDGWEFIATIIHTPQGNIINRLPIKSDLVIPEIYKTSSANCEHCNLNRARKDTYLIQNTESKEFKQVGKTCLADFTNNKRAQDIASCLEGLTELYQFKDNIGGGTPTNTYYPTKLWIARIIRAIKESGWVSSTAAKEGNEFATWSVADRYIIQHHYTDRDEFLKYQPTPEDMNKAIEIIEYFRNMKDYREVNDYIYNLVTAIKGEYIPVKTKALVASAVITYDKIKERETIKQDLLENISNNPIGEEGDKITLMGKLIAKKLTSSKWGEGIKLNFITSENQLITWYASTVPKIELIINNNYSISATIKYTRPYGEDGINNIITRAKLTTLE